ncbi:MAG TPA: hypothetical protein VNS61_15345, partial [Caldimonas sp.]|nr:hypothetical protein [Caldimonas sp.]
AQGEVGGGYSFQGAAPLLTIGAQGPFFNGGLDYLWGKGVMGSIGVNTLDRVRDPSRTLSCPTGFVLQGSDCVSSPSS